MGIYWTMADTASALIAGAGSMLGLYLAQIAQRLLSRWSG
jgi:hypothetical protein